MKVMKPVHYAGKPPMDLGVVLGGLTSVLASKPMVVHLQSRHQTFSTSIVLPEPVLSVGALAPFWALILSV